ncbi:MAG: hypothetical protein BHW66_07980 [Akkermansia sp. 54_46]|nr:MAG: hypothetical protein BHW66_07980 [Akkermansia sp. 54_46]
MNTEFIILFTLFHFPPPYNNHVMHVRQDQRKRDIKRNTRQKRDTAAGKRRKASAQSSSTAAENVLIRIRQSGKAPAGTGKYPET